MRERPTPLPFLCPQGARFGVVSMCIGSGMGAAAVFERGGEIDCPTNAYASGVDAGLSKDFRG